MFPKYVKIGPHYFRIKQVSASKLKKNNATIDFQSCCIHLSKGIPLTLQIESFLHECLHGILVPLDLHEELEELLVECLACGLVAGVLDNPTLARLLVNKLLDEKKKCEKPVDIRRSRP